MTKDATRELLMQLFGDKVDKIPNEVGFVFTLQAPRANAKQLKERLEETRFFDPVEAIHVQGGVMITVPYAQLLKAKEGWQLADGDSQSVLAQMLRDKQPQSTRIAVPLNNGIDAQHAPDIINQQFRFNPPVALESGALHVTIAQFQTMRAFWQQYAETDGLQGFLAGFLEEQSGSELAHGRAKKEEAEEDSLMRSIIERLSGEGEAIGEDEEPGEGKVEITLELRDDGGGFSVGNDKLMEPSDTPPDTVIEPTDDRKQGVGSEETNNVVRPDPRTWGRK